MEERFKGKNQGEGMGNRVMFTAALPTMDKTVSSEQNRGALGRQGSCPNGAQNPAL